MRLGDIIHKYRELHEMSMGDFAKLAGVSKAYIGFLEKGVNPKTGRDFAPSIKTIQSVANAMCMDFDELFNMLDGEVSLNTAAACPGIKDKSEQDAFAEGSGEQGGLHLVSVEDLPNVLPIYRHSIPVYRGIACGTPIEAAEHADYYAVSKEPIKANFAVIAKGDSMIDARIHDGDIVFIEKCSTVDNGEIAAVLIDGAATLKRVYYDADKEILSLVSENKAYAPMVYTKEDARDIRIMGRAICAQIFF